MIRGRLLLGGSFNPVHFGHLRLAKSAFEALSGLADGVDFIPCARPAHKSGRDFLPFELRCRLLESATAGLPWAAVDRLEGARSAPSYTWDTLREISARQPGRELFFLLGSEDFAQLPGWRNGLRLPELCSFVVAPRGRFDESDFGALCRRIWPGSAPLRAPGLPPAIGLAGGGRAIFLQLDWLDLSSTRVRARWLAGQDLAGLIPAGALGIMRKNRRLISECWQEKRDDAQGSPQGNA